MNRPQAHRYRAGQPAALQLPEPEPESTERPGDLAWVAYLLIAAVLTVSAIGIGFIAGRYFS